MMYRLKFSIKENGSDEVNPDINAEDVKNRTEFFRNDYYDDFIEPDPFFNDMKMYLSVLEDEEPKILNDAHGWAGNYPNKLWSFPVSQRLKNIFVDHHLVGSRFYPGTLNFQHKVYPYFVFHTLDNAWEKALDLDQSIFIEYDGSVQDKSKLEKIKIVSSEDYTKRDTKQFIDDFDKYENAYHIEPKDIHFTQEVDLVFLPVMRYVISERLKQALEKANISGLEFIPITDVEFYYQGEKL